MFRPLSNQSGGPARPRRDGAFGGRRKLAQVLVPLDQIQNLHGCQSALGGAQDVCEGHSALVGIPGAQGRGGERAADCVLIEPDDEQRVHASDEWCGAFDGVLCTGGGVTEAEELLEIAEADIHSQLSRFFRCPWIKNDLDAGIP